MYAHAVVLIVFIIKKEKKRKRDNIRTIKAKRSLWNSNAKRFACGHGQKYESVGLEKKRHKLRTIMVTHKRKFNL